jgi:hypothetical protein
VNVSYSLSVARLKTEDITVVRVDTDSNRSLKVPSSVYETVLKYCKRG